MGRGAGSLDAKGAGRVVSIVVTASTGGARRREPRDTGWRPWLVSAVVVLVLCRGFVHVVLFT